MEKEKLYLGKIVTYRHGEQRLTRYFHTDEKNNYKKMIGNATSPKAFMEKIENQSGQYQTFCNQIIEDVTPSTQLRPDLGGVVLSIEAFTPKEKMRFNKGLSMLLA